MANVATAPIVFGGSEDSGSTELGGAIPTVVNAVMDKTGAVRRRPAIAWASDFVEATCGGAIIGMVVFKGFLVYVSADRMIHAIKPGTAQLELSIFGDVSTKLAGKGRPSFVAGRNLLVIAGGGDMQKWDGVTATSLRLTNTGAGGPPPSAEFVCAVAQRLLLSSPGGSGNMVWSGPLEAYEDWDFATSGHAGYTQASAKPDPIKALLDNTNELFCVGSETTQVMAPSALTVDSADPNNVSWFAPNRTSNVGTVAPYSVLAYDDMVVMLDRLRRVILTDARTYSDIGKPMATRLQAMQSIEDCWAFRMKFGRFDAVVFVFPTDGYGLIYDAALGNWGEWRASGDHTGPKPLQITSVCNWSEKGVFLIGLADGHIAQLDDVSTTDSGSSQTQNNPIKIELVSGFTNHGSMAKKDCRSLTLTFKRTWAALPPPSGYSLSASGHVRLWNRDDMGAWQHVVDIELSNDSSPCEVLRSLGVYRTRQWKLEYDGADEIQLVSAEEEFEPLGA